MLKPPVIGRALGAVSPAMFPFLGLSARLLCSMQVHGRADLLSRTIPAPYGIPCRQLRVNDI